MTPATRVLVVLSLAPAAAACGSRYEGGGDLRAERVVLEREVEGLRQVVERLDRGEPWLPVDDIAIGVEDTLVRDLIAAQLPVDLDINRFHLRLADADVQFRGSPVVRLSGRLQVRDQPSLSAEVTLLGALEDVRVNQAEATLTARVSADHLAIGEATGLSQVLSGATLDEVARTVRLEIGSQLPTIRIPVKVQQQIDFAPVTDGPVRIGGARLPLEIAVSQVSAARGRLWVSVHVRPGEFIKLADAPAVADGNAAAAGVTLDDEPAAAPGRTTPRPKRPPK
jgi:hypothetical protein